MKALKYILTICGIAAATNFCNAQTEITKDTATGIPAKTVLQDSATNACEGCDTALQDANNLHVSPYYQENKPYSDIHRTANMKPGVFGVDGEAPSINGARPSGTAYYYNGIRLIEYTPPRTPVLELK